jgi:hypothetical protein
MNLRRLALSIALLLVTSVGAEEPLLLEVDQDVAGTSQAQWSRAWWQWATSFDREVSPVADTTGERCTAGQHGPVWFLAGTYASERTSRTCQVPAGKYLFFPLINYVVAANAGYSVNCSAVMVAAFNDVAGVSQLVLRVDGNDSAELEKHRVSTRGCFDLGVRKSPPERIFPAAADGYYVMLSPLSPGRHTIDFGGTLPRFAQEVSYTIYVR